MKTDWVKMTDRRPTEQDLPVWAWYSDIDGPWIVREISLVGGTQTHWRPAAADIPEPPRGETQREKDQEAFVKCEYRTMQDQWHAALAWERGEVAKMLPPWNTPDSVHDAARIIESIRARCGGGGK